MSSIILIFLAMMIPLLWSPGPNNIMCATVGAKQGTIGSIPFIVGLNFPIFIYALLTGFGLAALIYKIPVVEPILTSLGAFYVIYLGFTLFKGSANENEGSINYGFKSGLAISSLNLKVVTVLILMYSQFNSSDISYTVSLSLGFVAVCIVGHFIWNFIGQVAGALIKNERFLKIQNSVYGLMLVLVGVWMVIPQIEFISNLF